MVCAVSAVIDRLTAKPVARRIETMIIAASPQSIKDELNASRASGLLPLLCRMVIIYGPGSLTERELGLLNRPLGRQFRIQSRFSDGGKGGVAG